MAQGRREKMLLAQDAAPGTGYVAVTPNDGTDLALGMCRALWIDVGGTISIDSEEGDSAVSFTVPAGLFPIGCKRVRATGTTATGIKAIY
jgi:hypothetical protein